VWYIWDSPKGLVFIRHCQISYCFLIEELLRHISDIICMAYELWIEGFAKYRYKWHGGVFHKVKNKTITCKWFNAFFGIKRTTLIVFISLQSFKFNYNIQSKFKVIHHTTDVCSGEFNIAQRISDVVKFSVKKDRKMLIQKKIRLVGVYLI
jgi:hypothetical protein